MDRVDFLLYWIWMWIILTTSLVAFDSAGAFDVYVLLFFYALHWCCVLIFICWLLQANVILLLKWLYASCSYKHLNILLKLPLGSPLFSTQLMKRFDSCISNKWDYLNMCYPQPYSFTCKIFYKCWNLAFVYLHFDIPYSTCICSPPPPPLLFFTWYFVTLNHDWHGLDFVWFITLFHERVHDLFCHFNWHSTCSIIKICIQVTVFQFPALYTRILSM